MEAVDRNGWEAAEQCPWRHTGWNIPPAHLICPRRPLPDRCTDPRMNRSSIHTIFTSIRLVTTIQSH